MTDTADPPHRSVLDVTDVAVRFGEVRALDGVSLSLRGGECVGLVGHNGAGKSTIVSVINGALAPHRGSVGADGAALAGYSIAMAQAMGLRTVHQELSLCPNLTSVENMRVLHRGLAGRGWRARAAAIITASLDAIFPGHGIDPLTPVGALSIAGRQMVEIAVAFADAGTPPRLVILDEPTSSLDAGLAARLLAHVRRFTAAGGAVILISHILDEILTTASRIVVMKDGRIVAERGAGGFSHASLVEAMGSVARPGAGRGPRGATGADVLALPARADGRKGLHARQGEVIGLAGLGGHGQTGVLTDVFARLGTDWWPQRDPRAAFVAGDRRLNGSFDLWSILRNISAASLGDLARHGIIRDQAERAAGARWCERMQIRTPDMENPILSLSGGNQQKVLFARALLTRAPIVLMDDPMRGVDIGTKQEVYAIIRAEAGAGRTFLWYSTEIEEMTLCDRVYVFRNGAIVAELEGAAITEAAILAASFHAGAAA